MFLVLNLLQSGVIASLIGYTAGLLFLLFPVVSIVVAVLRYRLYDIDVLINRTLVYGALTVSLAAVYFGGVTATEATFRTLTGQEQQPQLAVVVSTLVIAALFNPLRLRIQALIDRRFYRRKYDARETLEAFSAKLRDETDLDALSEDLVEVVGRRCNRRTSPCGCALTQRRGEAKGQSNPTDELGELVYAPRSRGLKG